MEYLRSDECAKCKNREVELFIYNCLPRQWYHDAGKYIWLCHDCIKLIDKMYPLTYVLNTDECFARVNTFLTKK